MFNISSYERSFITLLIFHRGTGHPRSPTADRDYVIRRLQLLKYGIVAFFLRTLFITVEIPAVIKQLDLSAVFFLKSAH